MDTTGILKCILRAKENDRALGKILNNISNYGSFLSWICYLQRSLGIPEKKTFKIKMSLSKYVFHLIKCKISNKWLAKSEIKCHSDSYTLS